MTINPSRPHPRHLHLLPRGHTVAGSRRVEEKPPPRWVPWAIVVSVLAAVVLGVLLARGASSTEDANVSLQGDKAVAEGQRDAAVGQSLDLASLVRQACSTGDLQPSDPLCTRAAQVQAQPIPGTPGRPGDAGAAGRGVVGTSINPAGRLLVTFTDGLTQDVGQVVGVDGKAGADGRGITGSTLQAGRLVLTFSDGGTQDVGPVVGGDGADGRDGRDGRGVASVDQVDGRLVVTFTDGDTQDVGPVPVGPRGEAGPAGPTCPGGSSLQTVTYADGRAGLGCVLDEQPVQQQPTPTAVPEEGGTGG